MNAILASLEHNTIRRNSYSAEELLPQVEDLVKQLVSRGHDDRTNEMAQLAVHAGGKRVRARLALHACMSFDVDPRSAIAWSAAVELLHNATLVHDDIQDGDTQRRGRPTIWAQFGAAQAINAGDFLLMLPFLALNDINASDRGALSMLIADYATRIVRGQVDELDQNLQQRVDLAGFLAACEGKTGALLALPVVGAALLGKMSLADAERFAMPFVQLGVMFQLQDDVVDLFGNKGRGTRGGDIYEGKVSALLVTLLSLRPELERLVFSTVFKPREQTTAQDVETMKDLYLESGALTEVLQRLIRLRNQVLESTILRSEPRLYAVAERLSIMALEPIQHLFREAEL